MFSHRYERAERQRSRSLCGWGSVLLWNLRQELWEQQQQSDRRTSKINETDTKDTKYNDTRYCRRESAIQFTIQIDFTCSHAIIILSELQLSCSFYYFFHHLTGNVISCISEHQEVAIMKCANGKQFRGILNVAMMVISIENILHRLHFKTPKSYATYRPLVIPF